MTEIREDVEDDAEDQALIEQEGRLTNWKHEPDLRELKKTVEDARPYQQLQIQKISRWLDNLNITGQAKLKPQAGRSKIQPKLIRKQAEWRYSALSEPFLSSDKLFKVDPVSWDDRAAAQQNELVLNWQFRTKLNPIMLIDQMVRTCTDEGTVILRTGWNRDTVLEKVMAPVWTYYPIQEEQAIQALQQAMELQQTNPDQFTMLPLEVQEAARYSTEIGQPVFAEQTGEQEVEQEKVLVNEPTVEVINTANLIIDPMCGGDPDKALFMHYSDELSRSYLERDGRYKNLDKVNWGGQSILAQPDHETRGPSELNFEDKARQKVILNEHWCYYDIHGDGRLTAILVAWIGDVVVRCELNPFPDKKPPFTFIPYLPVKRSVYGEPDGEVLEDNQKILGAVTRGVIDMMARSAAGQRGMAKSMLDVPNKRRFDRGEDYEFNPNIHPANGIIEHKYPEIPNSAMNMIGLQNSEAESMTGVKSFSNGMTGDALGKTATGARGALDAAGRREMGILRRLAKGMSIVGRKVTAMNQEFLSEEEVIRVTNETFIKVRRDELQGHFDFKIDIATASEDAAKAEELSYTLQTMGPNLDLNMSKIIMAEISRLRRMPDLAKQIREYEPQPDPLAQRKAELEIELLQAQVALTMAQAQERQGKSELDSAAAREKQGKADQNDLDYVEQETGTKHARDIDKIEAQNEGLNRHEITKAILSQRPAGAQNPESSVPDAPPPGAIAQAFGYNELEKARSQ